MAKTTLQLLVDAGVEFSDISRKQAESIVQSMVKAGEVRRSDAEQAVQTLLDRGRETSERLNDTLQKEFSKQVNWLSERFDELEDRFEELAEKIAERVKNETAAPAKKAPARSRRLRRRRLRPRRLRRRRLRPRRLPAKKAPAKKAPAKKARPRRLRQEGRGPHHTCGLNRFVATRRRLDAELVRRELVTSRTEAQTLIAANRIIVNGAVADKAARQVAPGDAIVVEGPPAVRRSRRREARSCARRRSGWTSPACGRSTSAPRPEDSPTACCSGARPTSSPSTSVTASSTSGCADDPRVTNLERCNVRHADARRHRRTGGADRRSTCRSSR